MTLYYIGILLVIIGLFAIFSGIIGFFRFPDFYTKLHAASVIESCGVPICLIGFACIEADVVNSVKLILAALLIFILNPVATHALGKASLFMKIRADSTVIARKITK
ncbi:MAG TPA: Na+/H+ antiporter subunit G [Rickettsia endosymbiont of Proechinophthirus fluctus]|uniref:Na+/H+ antiporter subunit G n=1 Tax=Rickettsia endosymbiont of Proechinophthirus fluctus TaxID=1462733 RepID=UPI000789D150|nr:Na+/H+ antiporter subunit G [Rickettsia endosymbiont of Proechinophthirus fluctus]KYP97927.1 cation:proton antiporter [Rickettsia endosymbiont of Proechinophthirus fluctus]HJD54314.1 Na+/H+ antiporter subunit G [Rickettsia endosymbiont of Proechinophthirus fluctus]